MLILYMAYMNKSDPSRPPGVFTASERRDRTVKAEIERARAALDAKTERLRALRLAREAEEQARAASMPKTAAKRARKKS
jgi:hypothetical protein